VDERLPRSDPDAFARSLAWRLRGWLAAPPAAVGWGTLRAIVKPWVGFPPRAGGVRSAGNGAAMRAPGAIVGGLAGATVGAAGLPSEWIDGIAEHPRSLATRYGRS